MLVSKDLPFVTLIIPCRNEFNFIEACIDSILENDYPKELTEIFFVDGLSDDCTMDILKKYEQKYIFIKIIENRKKIFPSAVNIGFNASKGDYIMILGAHAVYDKGYISTCIKTAIKYSADNTGGVLKTIGLNNSFIGKSISFALSSSFGVGNATFRTGCDEVKEVDTVFGGCYKREVFERIGLFNENLISSSDMDFNVRLKKNKGKIILDPSATATYYTRNTFKSFLKNNFRNGFWAIYPMKYTKYIPVRFRHLVPSIFISGIVGLSFLSFISINFLWLMLVLLSAYFLTAYIFSSKFLSKGFHYFAFLPVLFFILHFSYGIGSLVAVPKVLMSKII